MRKFHCLPMSIQLLIAPGTYACIARFFGQTFPPIILLNSSAYCRINVIHPPAEVRRMLCIASGNGRRSAIK